MQPLAPGATQAERAQRWARQATFVSSFGAVVFLLALALLLAEMHPASITPFALLLLGLSSLLAAPVLAAAALFARRGTDAPEIVVRSAVAMLLGALALMFALVVALWVSGAP